jgi:FkbM family methyltransferase
MQIVTSVRSWLGKAGIYVSRERPYTLNWQVRALFEGMNVNCVIDVGAHFGEYGRFLRNAVGYSGRIVSFEPVSASHEVLVAESLHDPKWLAFPHALGAESARAKIHVFESGVFNSFLPPTQYVADRFGSGGSEIGVETVSIRKLDELLEEATRGIDEPRIYLKMDTQGYDQEVLAGARNTLRYVVGLQSEIAVKHLYEGAPDFEDAVHRLRDLGFAPLGFFPVARESDDLGVVEFDCVAIRR